MTRPLELTGRTFGRWTVLRRAPSDGSRSKWHVLCVCGHKGVVQGSALVSGASAGCLTCHNREVSARGGGSNAKDLTDQVFGKWTVLEKSHTDTRGEIHWLCVCVCGTRKAVEGYSLRSGRSTQCRTCSGRRMP